MLYSLVCAALAVAASAEAYDESLMHIYAELAGAAYAPLNEILAWNCSHCVASTVEVEPGMVRVVNKDEIFDGDNATQVIVGKFKNQTGCFMSFRGSSNLANWIRNLQIDTTEPTSAAFDECPGCKIHHGFLAIWLNARDDVHAALQEVGCNPAANGDTDVYITGHSLGAALSHLAMFTLSSYGYSVKRTFSFEAPRVGDFTFRDAFDSHFGGVTPVWRMTHDRDPVVHLPPELLGYEHVAEEVFYSYEWNGALQHKLCSDSTGEDRSCSWKYYLYVVKQHCNVPFVDSGNICNNAALEDLLVV
eukprot:CAMPEP_0194480128 /NCGR_PEP_ID=MMETSP0253-20130528/3034_1 /TAXON_ID=2966 /ORGANISM="Noctiluca scintillans" /LENGTH=303 /DNA_ID=CAMNT_0039319465 /DNA_START=49 /DNA_END=960 /DNA_ORIENTATION=+